MAYAVHGRCTEHESIGEEDDIATVGGFGRKEVVAILGCSTPTGARIMSVLKELDLIIPIKGNGKGRYMFKELP